MSDGDLLTLDELSAVLHGWRGPAAPRKRPVRHRRFIAGRRRVLAVIAAALAVVGGGTAAFADQIGSLIGLYNHGKPIPASAFPNPWAAEIVSDPTFGNGEVRQVGHQDGITFYAAKNASGHYCLGVGFAVTPSIDALTCGSAVDAFVGGGFPVEDFSSIRNSNDSMTVTRLAGFANATTTRLAVLAPDGSTIYAAPVAGGLYATSAIPPESASAIVALDANDNVIYRRALVAPPAPVPAMP